MNKYCSARVSFNQTASNNANHVRITFSNQRVAKKDIKNQIMKNEDECSRHSVWLTKVHSSWTGLEQRRGCCRNRRSSMCQSCPCTGHDGIGTAAEWWTPRHNLITTQIYTFSVRRQLKIYFFFSGSKERHNLFFPISTF